MKRTVFDNDDNGEYVFGVQANVFTSPEYYYWINQNVHLGMVSKNKKRGMLQKKIYLQSHEPMTFFFAWLVNSSIKNGFFLYGHFGDGAEKKDLVMLKKRWLYVNTRYAPHPHPFLPKYFYLPVKPAMETSVFFLNWRFPKWQEKGYPPSQTTKTPSVR